jgi:radical SAM superfamily enzyme YgiQ (UPF0313 family)
MNIVLISTYELGHQPFGLASPAAWLREAGASVTCVDLAVAGLPEGAIRAADMVALYVPMHTATRLAVELLPRIRQLNQSAHLAAYGLYAPLNEPLLRELGVSTIIGGEFEAELVKVYRSLESRPPTTDQGEQNRRTAEPSSDTRQGDKETGRNVLTHHPISNLQPPITDLSISVSPNLPIFQSLAASYQPPSIVHDRLAFRTPDRTDLPPLTAYARLSDGVSERVVGYTEASRGCKHRCRHCPIVPIYNGRFRIVSRDVVLEDIRRQVAAGAGHITFGDPDFLNGPGHAIPLVQELHREFPELTYDVTIKVEHLLKHRDLLPTLRETGCAFVISAVESVNDHVLGLLEKGHTRADVIEVSGLLRQVGLSFSPTFVTFTPWTSLAAYRDLLALIAELGLVGHIAPIQYAIRLLIPSGSRLLELDEVQRLVGPFDQRALCYPWQHPDPQMDALHERVRRVVQDRSSTRHEIFGQVWRLAYSAPTPVPQFDLADRLIPHMSEPWYC